MLLLLVLLLALPLSSVLPTTRGRMTLLNYRLIVANALIYDLIAMAEMLHDFDKSAVSTPTATNANNRNVDNNSLSPASATSVAVAMQMPTMSDIFVRDNENCRHNSNNNNNNNISNIDNNNNSNSTFHIAADKQNADTAAAVAAVAAFAAARTAANSGVAVVAAETAAVVAAVSVENCTAAAINVHVDNLENRKNQMALLPYRNMSTTAGKTATTKIITTTNRTALATTTNPQPRTVIATAMPANPRASSQSQPAITTTRTTTTTAATTRTITTTTTTTAIAMPAMHCHDLLSPTTTTTTSTNGPTSSCATQMPELPTAQTQTQTQIRKFPTTAAAAPTPTPTPAASASSSSSSSSSSAVAPTRPTQVSTQQSAAVTATTPKSPTTTMTSAAAAASAQALPTLHAHWQRILSRPKRYLAFPEGSSFSVAVCITVGIIGNPRYNYMSYGLNWGVAYDLPNATWVLLNLHGLMRRPVPTAVLRRRTRRALYAQIEDTIDNMGYNGRDCVLRALCESRQYFSKTKMSMIGEMLRVVFSLPKQRILKRELEENSEIAAYDHAYRKAREVDCAEHYDCAFSLLELAFGKYAKPPPNYYEQFGM